MSAAISAGLFGNVPSMPPTLGTRLKNDLDLGKIWPSFLVWLVISICTVGLGWIVVSGHFFKAIINTTYLVDASGRRVARLRTDYDVEADLGRIVMWVIISILTLGVGLLFYSFHAARSALDATVVEPL